MKFLAVIIISLLLHPLLFSQFLTNSAVKEFSKEFSSEPAEPGRIDFKHPVTNSRIITNQLVENGKTNYSVGRTNLIYMFFDPFLPLSDIGSPDDLKLSIANMFMPLDELLFTNRESRIFKKHRFSRGVKLMTEDDLTRYSEEAFLNQIREKQKGILQFTEEEKKHLNLGFEEWETKVVVSGWVNLSGGYGWLFRSEDNSSPIPGVPQGLNLNQNMRVNIVGKIGERVQVNINHSSDNPDNEYEIAYKALDSDKGVLKELRAGNISLNIPQSSYFVKYAGTSKESYGVKSVFEFGDLDVQAVLNLTTSKKGYKKFVGLNEKQTVQIPEVNYVKRKYFLLPDTLIDAGTVELLVSTVVSNIADRRIDSLYYKRMVEGVDYFVNLSTGELTLTNNLDRSSSLVVRYTKGGAQFTTNVYSEVGSDDTTGDKFLYLWRSTANFSQYIHYGYYQLGYNNFDPTRGFSMTVVYTSDKTKVAPFQFTSADYVLSSSSGIVRFNSVFPFPDVSGGVYTNAYDPGTANSTYMMIVTFYNKVNSYQLDYGIIAGTERVYLNGKLLPTSDYTVLNATGELMFNNQALINENDVVEVYYEYKPFWSGSQKIGIATRMDWKPSNVFNLGSTIVYNISQHDAGAPSITATPEGVFMADLDGNVNIARMFKLPEEFEINLKSEVAISVRDPNTVGYAIIDDFESTGETFSFSKSESRWILSAPDFNISNVNYTNRGQLLYKDYRDYAIDGSYNMLNYSYNISADKIKDYSFKPGPYYALGGHLSAADYPSVSQSSLIFDYDFRQGGNWVGAAYSLAGPSGVDLSEYNQIVFWVKLQGDDDGDSRYDDSGSGSVDLFIAVGGMNEDADGSGVLEYEIDRAQAGYAFHNYNNPGIIETYVGRGRLGGGDGNMQTEDLNGNGILDTNRNTVVFPSTGYTDISNATVSQGDWTQITINIRSLSAAQISTLQHATSIGLYIRNKSGSKGRLLVDVIDFKKISWKEKYVDGIKAVDSQVMMGDSLSVFNDPKYSANRFYNVQSSDTNVQERVRIFEKLHGPKTVSEAQQFNERSIGLTYSLTNVVIDTNTGIGGMKATLVKRNTTAYDLSKYKYMNFYVFIPDTDDKGVSLKTAGDTYTNENFILLAGSSDNSYYKWSLPLDALAKNQWHQVVVDIFNGLTLKVDNLTIAGHESPEITGYPNLVDVNYLQLGVEVTSLNEPVNDGVVWVDEMYVNDDESEFGVAYYVNPSFEYKKPVLAFGDFEVLGPVALKAYYENKDVNFIPSEGTANGSFNNNFNVSYNSSLFRNIMYSLSYNDNSQGTTTNLIDKPKYLQWDSRQDIFNYSLSYASKEYIPSVSHSYTEVFDHRLSRTLASATNFDYVLGTYDEQYSSSAKIALTEFIPIVQSVNVTPRFSFEDSFYLFDRSNYTNEDSVIFVTNSSVYGMKNRRKTLQVGSGINLWMFNLSGDYSQTIERYSKIMDQSGYRRELADKKASFLTDRYGDRIVSLFQGFYFPDENLEKQNSENYSVSLGADRPLPFFSFWLGEKLGRNAGSYTYDNSGVLVNRAESYVLGSDTKLNLYPKWPILDTVNLRVVRDFQIGYSSIADSIFYSNIFADFSKLYYDHLFVYSGFFGGNNGRTNSLNVVEQYSEGRYASSSQFSDGFTAEIILSKMGKFFDTIIPKRYVFNTVLLTGRSLSSYYQSMNNQFDTSLPVRITEWGLPFLKQEGEFKLSDLLLGFSYHNTVGYNERKITDTLSFSASETLWFNRLLNLFLSYTLSYSADSYITNSESFEKRYGFTANAPNNSPVNRYGHAGSIVLNWTIENVKELDLLLFKIDMNGSSVNNREGLLITGESIAYTGYNYSSYMQKLYEFTLDHSTEFRFSDYITGSFIVKAVLNQYAQVTPLANSAQTSTFPPGFGLQLAIDVKIRF